MKFRHSTSLKATTCSGSRDTGLGMMLSRTSSGLAVFGATCRHIAVGFLATGLKRMMGIAGFLAFGQRRLSMNRISCLSHRPRSTRDLQRPSRVKSIFMCPAIGFTRKATTNGLLVIGSPLPKTGSGFLHAISGRLAVVFISLATGTTNFRGAARASRQFSSLDPFTWPTTIATNRRMRSI